MFCGKHRGICLSWLAVQILEDVMQERATYAMGFDREEADKTCKVSEAILWLPLAKQLCCQWSMALTSLGDPCAWVTSFSCWGHRRG